MELSKIATAAEEIAQQAATGPGPNGARVANTLSPSFVHYTTERIRRVLFEESTDRTDKANALFDQLGVDLAVEDDKLRNVMQANELNADAVRAVTEDSIKTRLELLEGLHIQLRALLREKIV